MSISSRGALEEEVSSASWGANSSAVGRDDLLVHLSVGTCAKDCAIIILTGSNRIIFKFRMPCLCGFECAGTPCPSLLATEHSANAGAPDKL